MFVQSEGACCCFYHFIDVACLQWSRIFGCGRRIRANYVLVRTFGVCDDGVHSPRQGPDRTRFRSRAVVADDATSCSVLLVRNPHCCFPGGVKNGEAGSVWYDVMRLVVEGDVTHAELLGTSTIGFAVSGILAHAEKIIEGDSAHVTDGLYLR